MLLYLIPPTRAAQFIHLVPFAAAIPVDSALGLTRKESSGAAVPFAASPMPQGKQAYWLKLWPRQETGRTVQPVDRTLKGIVESCRGKGMALSVMPGLTRHLIHIYMWPTRFGR